MTRAPCNSRLDMNKINCTKGLQYLGVEELNVSITVVDDRGEINTREDVLARLLTDNDG